MYLFKNEACLHVTQRCVCLSITYSQAYLAIRLWGKIVFLVSSKCLVHTSSQRISDWVIASQIEDDSSDLWKNLLLVFAIDVEVLWHKTLRWECWLNFVKWCRKHDMLHFLSHCLGSITLVFFLQCEEKNTLRKLFYFTFLVLVYFSLDFFICVQFCFIYINPYQWPHDELRNGKSVSW